MRTSVQRLSALGLIVRAVPAPASRRWGWTDPTTGKRRGSRRSTVYTLTGDAAREPRPVATIGADAEPSPELVAAVARVEAAHAAALARLDAPELLWCGVEAVDLVLADDAVDLVLAPVEAPTVAELENVEAPELVDVAPVEAVAPLAAPPSRERFSVPVDRQRLPPKSPRKIQSAPVRATAPASTSPPSPWLILSAAAVARATGPRSPVRAVEAPRRSEAPAVDTERPPDASPSPAVVSPELVARLRGLVSRRR